MPVSYWILLIANGHLMGFMCIVYYNERLIRTLMDYHILQVLVQEKNKGHNGLVIIIIIAIAHRIRAT